MTSSRKIDSLRHLVGFVICTFNQEAYLRSCIESIVALSGYANEPIHIVNDGSTDGTLLLLKDLSQEHMSLVVYSHENCGIERSCNIAIRDLKTMYYVRVDSDDTLDAGCLEALGKGIRENNFPDFIYGDYEIHDEVSGKKVSVDLDGITDDRISSIGDFNATGTCVKISSFRKIGGFDESTPNCGLENYSLVLRLIASGYSGAHVKAQTFTYRYHGNNMSRLRLDEITRYGQELHKKLGLEDYSRGPLHPSYLIGVNANKAQ